MSEDRGAASTGGTGGGADEQAANANAAIAAIPTLVKHNPVLISRIRNSEKIKSIEFNFALIQVNWMPPELCPSRPSPDAALRATFSTAPSSSCQPRFQASRLQPAVNAARAPNSQSALVSDIRHHPLTGHDVELVGSRLEIRNRITAASIGHCFSGIDVRRVHDGDSDTRD